RHVRAEIAVRQRDELQRRGIDAHGEERLRPLADAVEARLNRVARLREAHLREAAALAAVLAELGHVLLHAPRDRVETLVGIEPSSLAYFAASRPWSSFCMGSAPARMRMRAVSTRCPRAACISAVVPKRFARLASAPALSRTMTPSKSPWRAVIISGSLPST